MGPTEFGLEAAAEGAAEPVVVTTEDAVVVDTMVLVEAGGGKVAAGQVRTPCILWEGVIVLRKLDLLAHSAML